MANILDYLDWRGDLSFTQSPFNAVDNLIFSVLAYARLEELGMREGETLRLSRLGLRCPPQDYSVLPASGNIALPLLKKASETRRFGELDLRNYVTHTDPEQQTQFAALSFVLPDGSLCVAFRGTDSSVAGWREDFNIAFLNQTPAQREAVSYLNRAAGECEAPITVLGHSKGGNLAFYAASFCLPAVKKRLKAVYSNDGPGFPRSVTLSREYREAEPGLTLIIPENSVIGVLLDNKEKKTVVKSSAAGLQQHNPYTWQVLGSAFVETEQSPFSLGMDQLLDQWVDELDSEQRKTLVSAIFDSVEASGEQSFEAIGKNKGSAYTAIAKALIGMDAERRKSVLNTLGLLAGTGGSLLKESARESLNRLKTELERE